MTKEEMIKKLDIVMKQPLNHAIWAHDGGLKRTARNEIETCYGVLFSASILGLINEEEFENINHTLAHTNLPW